jgi:hypothetical protein
MIPRLLLQIPYLVPTALFLSQKWICPDSRCTRSSQSLASSRVSYWAALTLWLPARQLHVRWFSYPSFPCSFPPCTNILCMGRHLMTRYYSCGCYRDHGDDASNQHHSNPPRWIPMYCLCTPSLGVRMTFLPKSMWMRMTLRAHDKVCDKLVVPNLKSFQMCIVCYQL